MKSTIPLILCALTLLSGNTLAQSRQYSTDAPRPIPLTRPAMKRLIEDVKFRVPRIPLPELSDEDRNVLGDRSESYEARVKYHFLGEEPSLQTRRARGSGLRNPDSQMTLDYGFKVELFWIVSRTNNCQYCLGHQETKLLGAGRTEQQIAALDCDWAAFTPAEQRAFGFARKFTFEPHRLAESDFLKLEEHFTKLQILEMCLSMSWNNAINRWKEGVGVPQDLDEGGYSRVEEQPTETSNGVSGQKLARGTYLTATPFEFRTKPTHVAPVQQATSNAALFEETVAAREQLEDADFVLSMLQQVVQRSSRFPLVDSQQARQQLGLEDLENQNWTRLLANFPEEGKRRSMAFMDAAKANELSPLLKAQLRWIVARQDRAWYAVAHAWKELRDLGITQEGIFALDGNRESFAEREQIMFELAESLAASPVVLTDKQVARSVDLAGPAATVQAINFVSQLSAFDRITEAANLPFEHSIE